MNFFDRLFPGFLSKARGILGLSYSTYNASVSFNDAYRNRTKLEAVLSSPAVLKVLSLQCDLFSLGSVYVYDKEEKEVENDPFLKLIGRPNPFQSRSQFLWDFMFWTMLGTDYCLCTSTVIDGKTKMYMLNPAKIEWPQELENCRDHLVFSDERLTELMDTVITYRYDNGETLKFALKRLMITTDLTNGIGNFFQGPSRIDALYKIISNSEHALDSKNINVRFSGKFLVGSNAATNTIGLGKDEKEDIEQKMDSSKNVWPLKTMIAIRRFVEDMGALALDPAYLADYFLIGNMYGIPRDVLEAYSSATYENQEKARMAHVSYTLQPKGNDWMNSFERFFGYDKDGKNIFITWEDLPFMQVFEGDRADKEATKIESFEKLINLGVPVEEANAYLDTDFHPVVKQGTI